MPSNLHVIYGLVFLGFVVLFAVANWGKRWLP